jgi:hypothetical protein
VKKANWIKWIAIFLYGLICSGTIYRATYLSKLDPKSQLPLLAIVSINIEIALLIILQISIVIIFMRLYFFYRKRSYEQNQRKSICLSIWLYTIVFISLVDLSMRVFLRIIIQEGLEEFDSDLEKNIRIFYFSLCLPWINFSKVLTLSYLIFSMCTAQQQHPVSSDQKSKTKT